MALHVVDRLLGHERAERTAHYMEYDWRPQEEGSTSQTPTRRSLLYQLTQTVREKGVEAGLARYAEMRSSQQDPPAPDESAVNRHGYFLMSYPRTASLARKLFELNTRAYPVSANVWDSLGECCMRQGDREEAIQNYRKSLSLDPGNDNAKAMLAKLGAPVGS